MSWFLTSSIFTDLHSHFLFRNDTPTLSQIELFFSYDHLQFPIEESSYCLCITQREKNRTCFVVCDSLPHMDEDTIRNWIKEYSASHHVIITVEPWEENGSMYWKLCTENSLHILCSSLTSYWNTFPSLHKYNTQRIAIQWKDSSPHIALLSSLTDDPPHQTVLYSSQLYSSHPEVVWHIPHDWSVDINETIDRNTWLLWSFDYDQMMSQWRSRFASFFDSIDKELDIVHLTTKQASIHLIEHGFSISFDNTNNASTTSFRSVLLYGVDMKSQTELVFSFPYLPRAKDIIGSLQSNQQDGIVWFGEFQMGSDPMTLRTLRFRYTQFVFSSQLWYKQMMDMLSKIGRNIDLTHVSFDFRRENCVFDKQRTYTIAIEMKYDQPYSEYIVLRQDHLLFFIHSSSMQMKTIQGIESYYIPLFQPQYIHISDSDPSYWNIEVDIHPSPMQLTVQYDKNIVQGCRYDYLSDEEKESKRQHHALIDFCMDWISTIDTSYTHEDSLLLKWKQDETNRYEWLRNHPECTPAHVESWKQANHFRTSWFRTLYLLHRSIFKQQDQTLIMDVINLFVDVLYTKSFLTMFDVTKILDKTSEFSDLQTFKNCSLWVRSSLPVLSWNDVYRGLETERYEGEKQSKDPMERSVLAITKLMNTYSLLQERCDPKRMMDAWKQKWMVSGFDDSLRFEICIPRNKEIENREWLMPSAMDSTFTEAKWVQFILDQYGEFGIPFSLYGKRCSWKEMWEEICVKVDSSHTYHYIQWMFPSSSSESYQDMKKRFMSSDVRYLEYNSEEYKAYFQWFDTDLTIMKPLSVSSDMKIRLSKEIIEEWKQCTQRFIDISMEQLSTPLLQSLQFSLSARPTIQECIRSFLKRIGFTSSSSVHDKRFIYQSLVKQYNQLIIEQYDGSCTEQSKSGLYRAGIKKAVKEAISMCKKIKGPVLFHYQHRSMGSLLASFQHCFTVLHSMNVMFGSTVYETNMNILEPLLVQKWLSSFFPLYVQENKSVPDWVDTILSSSFQQMIMHSSASRVDKLRLILTKLDPTYEPREHETEIDVVQRMGYRLGIGI